jgi:hypothetical protein
MTSRVGLRPNAHPLARCLAASSDAGSNREVAECIGLNGIAPREAKPTTVARRTPDERSATRLGSRTWVSIVVAVIAVVAVLVGELWLVRAAPSLVGGAGPAVAADVSATLGRVAEVPLLFVPID